MDKTALSVAFFLLLKIALGISVVVLIVMLAEKFRKELSAEGSSGTAVFAANFGRTLALFAYMIVVLVYITMEMGYRPKTSIDQSNPKREERLRQIDAASPPEIKPSSPKEPSWEEKQKKNREENEASKREFESLPDPDKK
jgi:CBS domain containing-hemolysin-like protein